MNLINHGRIKQLAWSSTESSAAIVQVLPKTLPRPEIHPPVWQSKCLILDPGDFATSPFTPIFLFEGSRASLFSLLTQALVVVVPMLFWLQTGFAPQLVMVSILNFGPNPSRAVLLPSMPAWTVCQCARQSRSIIYSVPCVSPRSKENPMLKDMHIWLDKPTIITMCSPQSLHCSVRSC
eukprot:6455334-Amphidinium_carterae.1